MSLTDEFDKAVQSVTQERGQHYGHPADLFPVIEQIRAATQHCPDPAVRHILYMLGVKMARLCVTPGHLDSWIDIAGYARTGPMVQDRKND